MNPLQVLDAVVLVVDLPAEKLRKGALGTIVELLADRTYLVEFADTRGIMYAMPVLTDAQLLKIYQEPVTA